jgi:hypothetical protein
VLDVCPRDVQEAQAIREKTLMYRAAPAIVARPRTSTAKANVEHAISLRRPRGAWHPAWSVTLTVAIPIFMAAYVGIAEAASELVLHMAVTKGDAPYMPQLAGELDNLLPGSRGRATA